MLTSRQTRFMTSIFVTHSQCVKPRMKRHISPLHYIHQKTDCSYVTQYNNTIFIHHCRRANKSCYFHQPVSMFVFEEQSFFITAEILVSFGATTCEFIWLSRSWRHGLLFGESGSSMEEQQTTISLTMQLQQGNHNNANTTKKSQQCNYNLAARDWQ